MRRSFGLVVLGLVIFHVSGSAHLVKRQDGLQVSVGLPSCSTRSRTNGTCVPIGHCPGLATTAGNACPLQSGNNETGVCCPIGISLTSPAPVRSQTTTPTGPEDQVNQVNDRDEVERLLQERGLFIQAGSATALHNAIVFADSTSQDIAKKTPASPPQASPAIFSGHTRTRCIEPQQFCLGANKYHTYDGSCNNLNHADWGKSHTAFQRLLAPLYADGISKPRRSANGTALPSSRLVSTTILKSNEVEFSNISLFFMAFGQFVDHDLTLTPTTRAKNGNGIPCCPPEITNELRHPECMTIDIPVDDLFYEPFGQTCMEFVRTIPASPKHCAFPSDPREQINQLTSYIDGSMIYGSDERQAEKLRAKSGGKLLAGGGDAPREFPPHVNGSVCSGDGKRHFCFLTGDVRSAEQPPLVTIHIAFFREHNRIADELAELNSDWEDEVLFQETRKIMAAILQHVIYNEYLPVVVGDGIMHDYKLALHPEGFWDPYEPDVDASILNEFATAAFRFAHSAVPSFIKLVDEHYNETIQVLRDHFLKPYDVDLFNDYARGLLFQGSDRIDEAFTTDLTNHLFETNGHFGLDLPAMNIQRGRDHAIGTYTQARKTCGLEEVTSFDDLSKFMDPNIAADFSKLYENVEDIDLWIGGVVEKPLHGAAVGPTFACIIAEQFKQTKNGDRFWYERGNTSTSFTKDQLHEIRQSSIARILCDNSDISLVQPLALLKPTASNPLMPCKSQKIPKMSFDPWRNAPVWTK